MKHHRFLVVLLIVFLLLPLFADVLPCKVHATSILQEYNFADYDDYLRYLETIPDSVRFVPYVDLQSFGSYVDYCDNRRYTNFLYISYSYYTFRDANRFQLDLLVRYDSTVAIGDERYLRQTDGMTSMRYLESNKSGSILRGNLEYVYQDGVLNNILWKVGSVTFALGGPCPLAEYPADQQQTLLCDLLSIDEATANTALQTLMKDVPGTMAPAHNRTASLLKKLPWVGIAVAAVAGFFIIRSIVKKHKVKRTSST